MGDCSVVDSSKSNDTDRATVIDEWRSDPNKTLNNVNGEQNLVESLQNTTMNDNNTVTENQESNCADITNNGNAESAQNNQYNQKNHNNSNKKYAAYRKGRGAAFNKSNYCNYPLETSNLNVNFQNNNGAHVRGRGRGRGFVKRLHNENDSFEGESNPVHANHNDNSTMGHRGRGRGHHRGGSRGGRFKEKSNDGWYGNNEDGQKKKENDKSTGPKTEYIPPDIENEESIAGIEAGLNFDKYETIEVKVSGTDPPKRLTSFHTSGLRNILLDNLVVYNFSTPTPIQNYAIPIVIAGRDLMASAQTGSGKTVSTHLYKSYTLHKLKKYNFFFSFRPHTFYLFCTIY